MIRINFLVLAVFLLSLLLFPSFAFKKKKENQKDERYCVDVNCNGKRHYELSPPCFSMAKAIEIMRNRYPDCKITGASKGSCN